MASPSCGRGLMTTYCNTFRVMKKYHTCLHAHGRQSWDGAMDAVTKLHQHLPPKSTIIFSIQSLRFIQFPCSEVMFVTLCQSLFPELFILMSNENCISNSYEMQSFMKPNVPAIMTHEHQSFAATVFCCDTSLSEQYAIEYEAQSQR